MLLPRCRILGTLAAKQHVQLHTSCAEAIHTGAIAREQERPTHKVNLLGRPGQPGNLERHLGCVFDSSTRAQALRAMDRLQHDGLVTPTYADLAAPESWLVLTERGHAALRRRAMDPLDEALSQSALT